MLTTYFKRPSTQTAYYSGPAGAYLDEFTDWLAQHGYRHDTIRHRVQGAGEFGVWAQKMDYRLPSAHPDMLDKFHHYLSERGKLRSASGHSSVRWLGAQCFYEFLRTQRKSAVTEEVSQSTAPILLQAFEQWMQMHRGIKSSTLTTYRRHLVALLAILGERPEQFEAGQLRTFVLTYAEHSNLPSVKTRVKATRAFLRFLTATERCQPGLDAALPSLAQWRLSALPRYLPAQEVERVIAACNTTTVIGIRDKAIILLLARLGLRAGEVADLKHHDINWSEGTLTVIGKSRREAKLPLPQDVGDAVLHYLNHGRPAISTDFIFITAIAPWVAITSHTVTGIAARALHQAGVESPSYGAHVLRHSAATAWLRQGASLQVIGEVLRHRDTDTTAHYAKVDNQLLQQVIQPWPGASSC